jgi:hypothetical protein
MVELIRAKTVYLERLLNDGALTEVAPLSDAQTKMIEAALSRAKSTRDFEINLYWTRSAYFWGFQAVFFGSFGLLAQGFVGGKDSDSIQQALMLGFMTINAATAAIVSYLWLLMLKGAKFWQDNWERHIDILEDFVDGPLYKTYFVPSNELHHDMHFRPPSVTKINEMIARVITILWIAIFYISAFSTWNIGAKWLPQFNDLTAMGFVFISFILGTALAQGFNFKLRMNHLGFSSEDLEKSSHQIFFRNALDARKEYDSQRH